MVSAAVVINESLVRRDFSGGDPIGRRIRLSDNGPALTIVGIVADSKYSSLDAPAEPSCSCPMSTRRRRAVRLHRDDPDSNDPSALATRFRSLVSEIDGTQVPYDTMTLEQVLADSIAPRRLNLALFATFAAPRCSWRRSAIYGVHGLRSGAATSTSSASGWPSALSGRTSCRWSSAKAWAWYSAGIVAGVAGALLVTRFMESLLFEVRPADPLTFTLVVLVLSAIGLVACLGPALRASAVDPIEALRRE